MHHQPATNLSNVHRLQEKEYDLEDYPPSPASSPLALPSSSSSRRSKTRLRRPLLHYIVASLVISLSLFLLLHFFSASPPRIQTAAGPDGALGEGEPVKTFWEGTPRDNRLQELVQNYNREKEGFGVGHASLPLYRSEMLQALEQLVGVAGGRAVDEVDGVVVPLREALSCYLDVECAESHPIPNELFATAKIVDPLPAELGTWQSLNPSHSLRLFNNAQVASWVASRFPNSTIPTTFDTLPMPILKYDLFRLLVLLTRGGTYTDADTTALRPIADWTRGVVDLTDPVLALHPPSSSARESNPPSLIVGVEWSGHTERNPLNPLYTRSVGIVQWTFGASAGHPVILDATQRVVENSRKVAEGEYPGVEGDEARLHFDPEAARAVLEWSGPAVLSDAVAR